MSDKKPKLNLTRCDGNAFFILARAHRIAKEAGWTTQKWNAFNKEATSGDYDHLLQTCMKYFDVV